MTPYLYVLPIVSVLLLMAARIAELKTKRDTVSGPVRENLTFILFVTVGALIATASIVEYLWSGAILSWVWFLLGWVLGLLSFWLRRAAIAALGRFWSLHVEIRDNHEFVQTGPFRYVRHPVYFSMILELLAFAVLSHAWWTALAVPFVYVPVLLMRVRLEEGALIEKFGQGYRDYQRSTPAIFPRPW